MRTIGIKILVNGIALWVAALVLKDGIQLGTDAQSLGSWLGTVFLVAVIFGVVNALVKPIVTLFSLPFIVLTLGLFTLVVNALMLQLTSWLAGWLNLRLPHRRVLLGRGPRRPDHHVRQPAAQHPAPRRPGLTRRPSPPFPTGRTGAARIRTLRVRHSGSAVRPVGMRGAVRDGVCPQGSAHGTAVHSRGRGGDSAAIGSLQAGPMFDAAPLLAQLPPEFTTGHARGVGLSDKVLARLVRSGRVQPVRRGLFRLPAQQAADRGAAHLSRIRAVAAVFADDHAVSHLSAAALLGLPMPLGAPGPVHLTRLRACHRSRQAPHGVVIHHADSSVTPVAEHRGIRVTSVQRTAADCLRTLPLTASVPLVDAVLHHGWATGRQLEDQLAIQRRWTGVPRARLALAMTDGRRETWLESYSFVRLDRLGVPGWRAQVIVLDASGELMGRVDGLWADCAVVAEIDGRGKYLDGALGPTPEHAARAVVAEKVREDGIRDLGLEMVRWDLDELLHRPAAAGRPDRARAAPRQLVPLPRPRHLLTAAAPSPTGRTAAPESGHRVSGFGQRGASGREERWGKAVRRAGGR